MCLLSILHVVAGRSSVPKYFPTGMHGFPIYKQRDIYFFFFFPFLSQTAGSFFDFPVPVPNTGKAFFDFAVPVPNTGTGNLCH